MSKQIFRGLIVMAVVALASLFVMPAVDPAYAAPTDVLCTPDQVVVFTTAPRLHVRCASAIGNIKYFALSTADAALAARVLSIISTALVAGRTLVINYDPADLTGASIGCLNSDCRLIRAIGFGK